MQKIFLNFVSLTAYIDIDLTIVDLEGRLLPAAATVIRQMKENFGYTLVAWSRSGGERAKVVLEKYNLAVYFSAILPKPDFIIDDAPESILEHGRILRVKNKFFWMKFWERLFRKDVGVYSS